MVFYLTFEAFRANRRNLRYIDDLEEVFHRKVVKNELDMTWCERYAWSVDKKDVACSEDLIGLSFSCKAAILLHECGNDSCFDLNKCSLEALNFIFLDNLYSNAGIILDSPFYITKLISPKFLSPIYFEGIMSVAETTTPFELFSAGVKDICLQLENRIENPVMTYSTLQAVLKANNSLEAMADELTLLKVQLEGVAETGFS